MTGTSPITSAYVTCALRESRDEAGVALSENYGPEDLATGTLENMDNDCLDFLSGNFSSGASALLAHLFENGRESDIGYDFWLTRNRHGTGFWGRRYPDAISNELEKIAHSYGSASLYPGRDGLIYQDYQDYQD